jgi:crossover junction endodeoxyribonuclease RuvC
MKTKESTMKLKTAVLGVDPGLDGGVALMILGDRGEPDDLIVIPMPTKPAAKGRDVDGNAFARFIDDAADKNANIDTAVVEIVHSMPKQGVASSFKFGKSYGRVLGVLEAQMIPIHEVTPQRWKKVVLDGLGRDKADSIRFALNHFPNVNFKATDRSKNHHDGMAEATCLAEYGRRLLLQSEVQAEKVLKAVDEFFMVEKTKVNKKEVAAKSQLSADSPILRMEYDLHSDGVWSLDYMGDKRRNKIFLEAEPNDEDAALAEAAKFLKVDPSTIKILEQ